MIVVRIKIVVVNGVTNKLDEIEDASIRTFPFSPCSLWLHSIASYLKTRLSAEFAEAVSHCVCVLGHVVRAIRHQNGLTETPYRDLVTVLLLSVLLAIPTNVKLIYTSPWALVKSGIRASGFHSTADSRPLWTLITTLNLTPSDQRVLFTAAVWSRVLAGRNPVVRSPPPLKIGNP